MNRTYLNLPLILMEVVFCITLIGCLSTEETRMTDNGLYKNQNAREICHASYDRAMDLYSAEYSEERVATDYGNTHIVISGPEDGEPLFLLPGLFADASMWYANAGELSKKHRVFAVDLPVYAGKSNPGPQLITSEIDYARWYNAILEHYGYGKAAVAGLSYGAWVALALARQTADSVSAAIMLDPSTSFSKMRTSMIWKGFWNFAFFPSREKYRNFFTWMGGGYSDPRMDIWFEHMLNVIEYGSVGMMDVPQHRVYTPDELSMVSMPVLILAGSKPIIYKNVQAMLDAALLALPHARTGIIEDAGHSLNMEKSVEVNDQILEFLDANSL